MKYANLTRTYQGKLTLYEVARDLPTITVRTDLRYGHTHGFWGTSPIQEVPNSLGTVTPEVMAFTEPVDRTLTNPIPTLFNLILQSIEDAWIPDAFHLIFHSSGWDSRMISGAVKHLVARHGSDWLGQGLLFLSNRWEAQRFLSIMQAMGWPTNQYAAYSDDAPPDEHFSTLTYDIWRSAPFPRPANLFQYLPDWAECNSLIPSDNVQAFTGLWANEVWFHFFRDNESWPYRVQTKYGQHMITSMPIKAKWVEYPLVTLPILDILRRTLPTDDIQNGNALRRAVSDYACPEATNVRRYNASDGYHPISERLQHELDTHYYQTEFSQRVPWQPPTHSGNSADWGRWSVALLTQKLIEEGAGCKWIT